MSLYSQFTTQVKNVQRGSSTITSGLLTVNAIITAVNMSKSVLVLSTRTDGLYTDVSGQIISPTSLTFTRGTAATINDTIEWQVIEYY